MKTLNQQVFSNLMQKLKIQPAETNKQRFDNWMRNKVKSVHYGNWEAMDRALQTIKNQ